MTKPLYLRTTPLAALALSAWVSGCAALPDDQDEDRPVTAIPVASAVPS